MKVYTYSQARQQLASLLEEASRKGVVKIRRRDGSLFDLARANGSESGLDVPGLATGISTAEMVAVVRQGRAGTGLGRRPRHRGRLPAAPRDRSTAAGSRRVRPDSSRRRRGA